MPWTSPPKPRGSTPATRCASCTVPRVLHLSCEDAQCLQSPLPAVAAPCGPLTTPLYIEPLCGKALFRPPQFEPHWRTDPALTWLHVDQGSTKRGLQGVQGALMVRRPTI